ncbi:hypothetical protein ACAW74_00025 [Fibrella sp. WM1]|uniref:hypothetical protein n=1 Tax=Fibrella musci TaxID=3242485 RepID=UPI003520DCE7
MYTAYIGRRLVDLINARNETQLTVGAFFKSEQYFGLFFDDERYLQHVNNSKFDQAYKQKGKTPLTADLRASVLVAQQHRIEKYTPDGSFFLGGAAAEATAGTSGQVTDIALPISPEEVYASWIGAALGIGVSGGLNLLVDDDRLLLTLYEGWTLYRWYMQETPKLKPHQINTWNGWWLITAFNRKFNPANPFERQPDAKVDKATGGISLETQKWVKVMFALARNLPPAQPLTTYVYSLSQMNTTIGFIQIRLRDMVTVEHELRRQLFAHRGDLNDEAIDTLYNTELGFQRACELGAIGIQALEPESLRDYMSRGDRPGKPFKSPKHKDDPLLITYTIYQTWLMAMLDNQQLLNLSEEVAQILSNIGALSQRGKTTNRNLVQRVLEATSRPEIIKQLAGLVAVAPEQHAILDQTTNVVATMQLTQIPLFIALLKLKYAVAEAKSTQSIK